MNYMRRILRYNNGNFEWENSATGNCNGDWLSPEDPFEDIPPAIAGFCDDGHVDEDGVDWQLHQLQMGFISEGNVGDENREYSYQTWDWFDLPFVYFGDYDGGAHPYPNFIQELTERGYDGQLRDLSDKLQIMVNHIRRNYNLPIFSAGTVPTRWQRGIPLVGGILYHDNYIVYYAQHNLTAEENTIPPAQDTYRTRFQPFNFGPFPLPSPITLRLNRRIVLQNVAPGESAPSDIEPLQDAVIDYSKKHLYIYGSSGLDDITQYSDFYIRTSTSVPLLIGRITQRVDSEINRTRGKRFTFDERWETGIFTGGEEVEIGFSKRTD